MLEEKKGEQKETQIPLEELFSKLEEVVKNLENPESSLEESFQYYNEGMQLLMRCNETFDSVEKKVLVLDDDGETYEF